jgi:serine/threonine-protein kinase SRPK3
MDADKAPPHMTQELLGPMPKDLLDRGAKTSHFFKTNGALRHITCLRPWPLQSVLTDKYGLAVAEAHSLADFLLPMLHLNPTCRASAMDVLKHPWLLV